MAEERLVTINGQKVPLDEGIANVVLILNEKGYETICSCEGHYDESKDQYSTYWIWFKNGCYPLSSPQIDGYDYVEITKPKHAQPKHATVCKKTYKLEELIIYNESYKRPRPKNETVHDTHKRLTKQVLEWAKSLPYKNT